MDKNSDTIASGSVFTDFALVSYDEDTGRMLIKKEFDDGSEWLEPVAISIPDLFFMFKTEGIDPTDMTEELCFEFHKVRIKVGEMTTTTYAEDDDLYSDTYYYACYAVRE